MQFVLRSLLPKPLRRLGSRVLDRLGSRSNQKSNWEFEWQQMQWLELWKTPEVQAKCLEYWQQFRHLNDIRALVPLSEETRILDVGCGLSSVLHYLPGHRTGVDPLGKRYRSIYVYPFEVLAAPGES